MQLAAVRRSIRKLCNEIIFGFHIKAGGSRRGFHIGARKDLAGFVGICFRAVIIEHGHIIRQNHLRSAVVGGVFHLYHDRHHGIGFTFLTRYHNGHGIGVERLSIQPALIVRREQFVPPIPDTNFGIAGGDGQAIAAHVAAGRGIGQLTIQYGGNFVLVRRGPAALFGSSGIFHRKLHGDEQSGQCAVSSLNGFLRPVLIGKCNVQIFGCINRCRSFIRCRRCSFQRSRQIRIVFFSLPCLTGQGPGVHGAQNAVPVQSIDRIHEFLSSFAERCVTFGCFILNYVALRVRRFRGCFVFGCRSRHVTFRCGSRFSRGILCEGGQRRQPGQAHQSRQKECCQPLPYGMSFHIKTSRKKKAPT